MELVGETVKYYNTANNKWRQGLCCGYVYYPVGLYYIVYDEEQDKQYDVFQELIKIWSP